MSNEFKLYNDDCINVLEDLDDNSIDLIITSPPYNLGHSKSNDKTRSIEVKYNGYLDDLPQDEYEKWQVNVLNECYRVLKPTGLIYYNHKERHKKNNYFNPINLIQRSKFNPLQTIIWNTKCSVNFNIGQFVNIYEMVIVAYKSKDYMRIDIESEKHFDVWNILRDKNPCQNATFPLELPLRIINAYKDYDDLTVLDCFMGSGTTGIACRMLNRSFIGVELDKKSFECAKKRINNYQSRLI